MRLRNAWAVVCVLAACVTTFACITCDAEAGDFLAESLREMDTLRTRFNELAEAWQIGDAPSLDKMLTESFKDFPALQKQFVTDRNRKWTSSVEKWLQGDKNVLVVVGAGHLVGKESVVDLISRKGYKVEQR